MDALLDILADFAAVHAEKVARVQALYPHADVTAVSAYVYDARRAYVRGEDTRAERLTHKFIVTAHRSAPEFEPPAKPSLWARFWPWLAFVYTPTAALLTATEVWK